ncbi:hypothetical protein MKX03_010386, partial [Papaver bracteatum]
VTPLETIQTYDTNASITPIQTFDANTSVTLGKKIPGEKETLIDQGMNCSPTIASANLLGANQTSSSFTNTDLQPNSADISVPTYFIIPSPSISIPSSSSSSPLLLNSLSLSKKALDSVNFASQTLSEIINSAQSFTSDPCKLRICSALSKLLCEFPSDRAIRDEIHSQIDPSFHTTLDVLVSTFSHVFDQL